jgi:hypothetical protein
MNTISKKSTKEPIAFVGEISAPYYSPIITKGLVEFTVHPLQGGPLRHNAAQIIGTSGETYPVTVRATGRIQPDLSVQHSWQPGDFLVRVDGIEFRQAHEMRKLIQECLTEETPFVAEIINFAPSSTMDGLVELRVRPQPYISLHPRDAQLIDKAGKRLPVIIRGVEAAPPSPALGHFGDLIVFLEGITLEQASQMQMLIQEQNDKEQYAIYNEFIHPLPKLTQR